MASFGQIVQLRTVEDQPRRRLPAGLAQANVVALGSFLQNRYTQGRMAGGAHVPTGYLTSFERQVRWGVRSQSRQAGCTNIANHALARRDPAHGRLRFAFSTRAGDTAAVDRRKGRLAHHLKPRTTPMFCIDARDPSRSSSASCRHSIPDPADLILPALSSERFRRAASTARLDHALIPNMSGPALTASATPKSRPSPLPRLPPHTLPLSPLSIAPRLRSRGNGRGPRRHQARA